VRIVIAEDDALLREGLALLLGIEGHEVVAAMGDAAQLTAVVLNERPDVVIVDVRMPPGFTSEGIEAAVDARRAQPGLPVLVLSAHVERAFATDLLESGADGLGYLLKDRVGRVDFFVDALERVAAGGTAIDPEVVAQLLSRGHTASALARLSERESEVLALMAEGLGNTTIAARLFVTESAVHKHIRSIFAKLGLEAGDGSDRRVAAVLRYLDAQPSP
jgi:DNA-binding NarL/FixJ family response regulator